MKVNHKSSTKSLEGLRCPFTILTLFFATLKWLATTSKTRVFAILCSAFSLTEIRKESSVLWTKDSFFMPAFTFTWIYKIYFNGFWPRITRIKNKITAITKSTWIKLPSTWKPKKPKAHKTSKIIAIVVSIKFN